MKMFKRMIRLSAIFLPLLAVGVASLSVRAVAQADKNESRSAWKWEWNDDGWKKRMEIRGKAEFTDDYVDIKSVSEGGSVSIEEVRNGTSRRLDIKRDANGQLLRTYFLNGQARAIDEDARRWLAVIVLEAVRQSAVDADKRVQGIFERRGLSGVLEEISLVHGDYAKRKYFEALLKNRNLNASALQSVLREAARQISSDYDQSQLLIGASEALTGKDEALPAFFEATATIKSDYDRRRILSAMLKRSASNRELLLLIIRSAASISSDHDKALVLKEAAMFNLEDAALAGAFFQTVKTISSDYEHRGVLSAVLKGKNTGPEVLTRMLESATRISSDYEKATFLLEASRAYAGNDRLNKAFLQTVDTIKSEHERGRVLSAMLKNRQIN